MLALSALAPVPGDTTASIRFNLPAQPLTDALREFSRQAACACRWTSRRGGRAVAGRLRRLTAAEALRRLLAGTGLAARFADGQTALVARGDRASRAYTLTAAHRGRLAAAAGTRRRAPPPPRAPTPRCATRRSR